MKTRIWISIPLMALLPGLALAHIGSDAGIHHGTAFFMGFVHPFTGLDHFAAMLAVGIWSVLATRQVWAMPFAFAGLLLVGGLIGFTGAAVPVVEPMIAASLLVLGLMVCARVRLALPWGLAVVGLFALFHGIAHGSELPAAQAVAALSGMALGTMILHIAGMAIGAFFKARSAWYARVLGGGIALLGAGYLAGVL
ncbi:HupE/UreJ family protein [Chromobacterium phragmitis]|uniref:HupE/UreJ family protein n=1 Tax=Chromobacterium amazonense TaxID=1382803 RepID=UPI0021B78640|nr:HupE/UreJ family protein [Chromobacterium amazonense]MBM2883720.1 HupE/UreJ family protein [Chromobacterium amazonense]MDE1711766.1 HupE/UreJ family protein [Chromobacterium amazonense]